MIYLLLSEWRGSRGPQLKEGHARRADPARPRPPPPPPRPQPPPWPPPPPPYPPPTPPSDPHLPPSFFFFFAEPRSFFSDSQLFLRISVHVLRDSGPAFSRPVVSSLPSTPFLFFGPPRFGMRPFLSDVDLCDRLRLLFS